MGILVYLLTLWTRFHAFFYGKMIELFRDPIEGGIVVALAIYGLILAWTLLSRLGWKPRVLAATPDAAARRLAKRRFAGKLAIVLRRRPLLGGAAVAAGAGLTFAMAFGPLLSMLGIVVLLTAFYLVVRYLDIEPNDPSNLGIYDDEEDHPDPLRNYMGIHGGTVSGGDPDADPNNPVW